MSEQVMKVRNKRASLVVLPGAKGGDGAAYPLKRILPGVNLVSSAYLEALQGHGGVEALFDDKHGCLELVDQGDPLIPEGVRDSLQGTSVSNAKPLIADCLDTEQLERWLHNDDRAGIHRAIAARLAELEGTPDADEPVDGE